MEEEKKKNKNKIETPLAKDKEAAKKYNETSEKIYSHPYLKFETSKGFTINMLALADTVKKRLSELDEEEKEFGLQVFEEISKLKRDLGLYKRQAFKLGRGTPLLSEERMTEALKAEILELFGQLHSEEEIQQHLEKEGISVNIRLIKTFRQKHKAEIESLQKKYEEEWHTIGLTRKRSRLDQLVYIYNRTKQNFDTSKGQQQLPFSKEMRATIDQIRKEVEGEIINMNIDGTINVNATIQLNKTVETMYADINFLMLLAGRTAAKIGVNPLVFAYQLTNSWYAKHTGFKRSNIMTEPIKYPSSIIYNWDEMESKTNQKLALYQNIENQDQANVATSIHVATKSIKSLKDIMKMKMLELEISKQNLASE